MINTVEFEPNILAQALAEYLFKEFGTIRGKDDGDYLCVTNCLDLREVIKEYLNR